MKKTYTNVTKIGQNICVRYSDDSKEKILFEPTLYLPTNENTKFTDIYKKTNLEHRTFESVRDADSFIRDHQHIPSFDAYGTKDYVTQWITETYDGEVDSPTSDIRVWNFDIETIDLTGQFKGFPTPEQAPVPIVMIQMHDSKTDEIIVWGCGGSWTPKCDATYREFASEKEMLNDFVNHWNTNCPNVITGWNITSFDIPYLVNRLKLLFGDSVVNLLSPWRVVRHKMIAGSYGNDIETYDILGVANLDMMDCYKKFTFKMRESYRLDFIGEIEIGENKVEYDCSIQDFFIRDWEKACEYGVQDVRLVQKIDDKLKLLDLVYSISYMCKQNYQDSFSSVRTWENYIYSEFKSKGMMPHVKQNIGVLESIPGGFVKDPQVGMHDWIVSFDLASLYPSLIRQYNISPETKRERLDCVEDVDVVEDYAPIIEKFVDREYDTSGLADVCVTANGWTFDATEQGLFPYLMERVYNQRKAYKNEMIELMKLNDEKHSMKISALNSKQLALKIQINSLFGILASKYFLYYDPDLASAITCSGQQAIKWISKHVNKELNNMFDSGTNDYVLASDTDSIYLDLSEFVNRYDKNGDHFEDDIVEMLDKASKHVLEPMINKGYEELNSYMNAFENQMLMEREAIAKRGFFLAKKRYALLVHNNEGVSYATPKLKIMGLETARSSTPKFVREELEKCIREMLTTGETSTQMRIKKFRDHFKTTPPSVLAFPRGVNGISKYSDGNGWFIKGTPKHVKAAIHYNRLVKEYKLENTPIGDGDKIKFVSLCEPNPKHIDVIGWPVHLDLPEEFDLHKYINYNEMYEKSFKAPIESMMNVCGWESEKRNSLESLFG